MDAQNETAKQLATGFAAAWRTLLRIWQTPGAIGDLPPPGQSDHKFFLTMMFYCAVAPAFFLNAMLTVLNWINPRFWDFSDINPATVALVSPFWLLFGLGQAWLLGWSLYAGLRMFNVAGPDDRARILRFGWVAGAVILTFGAWWYGFGIPFYTLADSLELPRWFGEGVLTVAIFILFLLAARILFGGLLATTSGAPRTHILSGSVAGATLFLIGWNIINAIAFGFLGFVAMKVLR